MNKQKFLAGQRKRRRFRVRKRVRGTSEQPRLSIVRSNANIGCQLIDDMSRRTVLAVSTRDKDVRDSFAYGGNAAAAQTVGKLVGERALAAGIKRVRFDRGSCRYHGRVAALADAAREAGLSF